jgi:uncharacterized PurR-regulated membrane protein YhhQ (DUF165 family)
MTYGLAILAAYIATIFGANWAIEQYGLVPVGFGLLAPAGVYFVGLSFTLRDMAQDRLGNWPIILAILIGAALSALVAPAFAVASGLAFLFSETCDFLVYTPLRRRHFLGAVALSNTVGIVIDSALFLWLAFGSLAFIEGQVLAKSSMTLLAGAALWLARRHALLPRHASR